jgi:hypothetical protein
MMSRLAILVGMASSGCAAVAGSYAVVSAIYLVVPAGRVSEGQGATSEAAQARLEAADKEARATAVIDAITVARTHSDDVRLLRRAAAMARELGADASIPGLDDVLALLAQHPCPGLVDIGATREAFGDHDGAGDMYLRAARECASTEAAIAAVGPLRRADRCGEAVAALRDAWPRVDVNRRGARLAVLDAVAACSETITLRRNLSFVPADVFEDYLVVLANRAERDREYRREAQASAAARDAEARERSSRSHCESECSAARSSCSSSCVGDASCLQRCDSVGHVCSAGCGG